MFEIINVVSSALKNKVEEIDEHIDMKTSTGDKVVFGFILIALTVACACVYAILSGD